MSVDHDIEAAKNVIQSGGVVGMPTETVYGLAASIFNEEALKQIFAIKERPFFDPLIVHISDLFQKDRVVSQWPPVAEFFAAKFWPGPLTMVLPKHSQLNSLITAGLNTVGIRMPAHPIARSLIRKCNVPLAAPSANRFGRTSPTRAEHVRKGFEGHDIFVLDGGQSEIGIESTVISIEEQAKITILRPGAITKDDLENALKEFGSPSSLAIGSSNAAPGNTDHHYMPSIPLVIFSEKTAKNLQKTAAQVCIDFQLEPMLGSAEVKLDSSPKLAARGLYVRMREGSDSGAAFLYVIRKKEQEGGLWDSIWDRLKRASSRDY